MPIDPRRWPTLLAVASLLAGIALNVAIGTGAEALSTPVDAAKSSLSNPTSGPDATQTPTGTATPIAPTPTPTPLPEPVATSLSRTSGGTAAMQTVWMHGTTMANVDRVVVGGQDAQQLTLVSPTELRFVVPEADGFAPGTASISLVSGTDGAWIGTRFAWTYSVQSAVDREMTYAATHWSLHTSARYGYIPKNDCVNFTSQLLTARGWQESADWWNDGPVRQTVTVKQTVLVPMKVTLTTHVPVTVEPTPTARAKGGNKQVVTTKVVKIVLKKTVKTVKKVVTTVDASAAWVSSTAMSDWFASRSDLATRLTYAQRADVQIGDVVQFNWTGVGSSWDHTAVVSKIVFEKNGTQDIWYAEHTNHQLYGGSIAALMKLPAYAHMHVQFWHLRH